MNIEKESPQPMEVDETSGPTEVQDDSEKTLGDLMQEKNLSFKNPRDENFFAQMPLSFLRDMKGQRNAIQECVDFNVEEVLGIISTTAELQAGRGASIPKTMGDLMQEKNLSFKNPSDKEHFAQMSLSFLRDMKGTRDDIQKRVDFNVEEVLGIISTTAELQAGRGASILDGLDRELVHEYDYKAFFQRIEELRKWHTEKDERNSYLSPYFSLIQSSGMGKTRLFVECRARLSGLKDVCCKTILCTPIPVKSEDYFDLEIDAKGLQTLQGDDKALQEKIDVIVGKLNTLIQHTEEKFIVMLFDEAQGLMVGTDNAGKRSLLFRRIRWWLRERRRKEVVAVFAGTTAKLSNFFPADPPTAQVSRDPELSYKNYEEGASDKGKKLYDPFFALNTIGCLRKAVAPSTSSTEFSPLGLTEFERAALYGRPLFAHYQQSGTLMNKVVGIIQRLLLSSGSDYAEDPAACLSVLGSRVQMGVLDSFEVSARLVSSGYACLVGFTQKRGSAKARVSFMPDPVCASLAMALMAESWERPTEKLQQLEFKSREKSFWVQQAKMAFSSGLCRPEKGDVGEIFSALYMLFCGDVLRQKQDPKLQAFSVPLEDWFDLLKRGGSEKLPLPPVADKQQHSMATRAAKKRAATSIAATERAATKRAATERTATSRAATSGFHQVVSKSTRATTTRALGSTELPVQPDQTIDSELTISFIQVCRTYFRSDSYCEPKMLEYMYKSCTALYTYRNCQAIDKASAIRVCKNGQTTYHPLFVSDKNRAKVTKGDVHEWMTSMQQYLKQIRKTKNSQKNSQATAVCLLVLMGCSEIPAVAGGDFMSTSLRPFPERDVYRLVCIPENDEYGISAAIGDLGLVLEESELYASHAFMAGENSASNLLLKNSKRHKDVEELFQSLSQTEER